MARIVPKTTTFTLNGKRVSFATDPQEPLLYVLRGEAGLDAPKFGCGLAQCGACTVLLNGSATRACVLPVSAAEGTQITTVEGLGSASRPHPLQAAFIAEQAAQCGYCTNGMIATSAALLAKNPHPSDAEIKTALAGNLCRCGTHLRIVRAVKRAASGGTA